jgi:hypothetical protein
MIQLQEPVSPVPTYSQEVFERIAHVLGKELADVLRYANEFEAAATWYRVNIPPAEREGGPTSELRNRRPKNSKERTDLRKQRSRKSKTLSELRKKANQIEAAARKVLTHLGVLRISEASDGPGDRDLLIFLTSFSGSSEEDLIDATARIGRLTELLEGINAAATLKNYAYKATQEAVVFAKLLPKGHQGDIAAIGWISDMMPLYKRITGKEPRFSVLRPGPGRGQPAGRFLRFLQAAGEPLKIDLSPASARRRQRALQGPAERRQK